MKMTANARKPANQPLHKLPAKWLYCVMFFRMRHADIMVKISIRRGLSSKRRYHAATVGYGKDEWRDISCRREAFHWKGYHILSNRRRAQFFENLRRVAMIP